MANYVSREVQSYIVRGLLRGHTQRGLAEQLELDKKTIARHARWLGQTALFLLDQQRDLPLRHFQMDEFYTHVLAKRSNADQVKSPVVLVGQFLHFLAVEAESGFIVSSLVAPSNGLNATRHFLKDFDGRLARNPDGSYLYVPEVITDGHGTYWSVIEKQYPTWNYGMFIKLSTYETKDGRTLKKRMFGGIRREVKQGVLRDPDGFNTNRVEAVNGSARALNMRVHGDSKGFSKRFAQHREQFALWCWFFNYAGLQERRKQTPAMAAGVDQRLWTAGDLVLAAEEYREQIRETVLEDGSNPGFELPKFVAISPSTVWLYHSFPQQTSKVHLPNCRFCNFGAGVGGQFGASGIWSPFNSVKEAMAHGERVTPGSASTCRACLGERFRRGGLL